MTKRVFSVLAVFASAAALAFAGNGPGGSGRPGEDRGRGKKNGFFNGPRFETVLEGAQEVPPVLTSTIGEFEIRFNTDLTAARFELKLLDGEAITQAHLHCAPIGVNGPVVNFLYGFVPGGFDVNGDLAEFVLTDANIAAVGVDCAPHIGMDITNLADLAAAIADGLIYVNVHSVANPGGEVRGQLGLDD